MIPVNLKFTYSKRLWLLALLFIAGLMISVIITAAMGVSQGVTTATLAVATVVQQLLSFMLPAVVVAMMVTRLPADMLGVRSLPSAAMLFWAVAAVVMSLPAMNWLVQWFESLPWPQALRDADVSAQETALALIRGNGVAGWAVALSVVAVLPAICEEIFFRGALLRLFSSSGRSIHVAIWLTAVVFSLLHMQAMGFVPRVLLGAFFGYLLLWSGSLWTCVAAHFTNNALAVVCERVGYEADFGWAMIAVSAVVTAYCVIQLSRCAVRRG